jgi:CheY-like chemotaxis protein/HEAT repeat protein
MKRSLGRSIGCVIRATIVMAILAIVAVLRAQDPFGDAAAPIPADQQPPPTGEIGQPGAAAKAPSPVADAKQAGRPVDPSRFSLSVRAVLESNPQTPLQLVRAAGTLIDLGEPALAKPYVIKIHAAKLDDAALAEVVRRLGSGPLLKIAMEEELAPEGREFGERAIAAIGRHARNPQRLARLVEQLGDPSPETQRQAVDQLLGAHESAVPPLLAALNDPARKATHALARDALVALADDAIGPLLATLDGPDSAAKLAAVEALGRMGATEATPQLVGIYAFGETNPQIRAAAEEALLNFYGKTPTMRGLVPFLENELIEVLSGLRPLPLGADGTVELWLWDAAQSHPVAATLSADQARSRLAVRLARRLFQLSPNDPLHRTLYLVSLLEAEAYRAGLDNSVPRDDGSAFTIAAGMGVTAVEDALGYSLEHGHAPAAMVAAQVLAEIGDAASQLRGGAEPAPLAKALIHADARLRFAASQAIVALKPRAPFAGLSHLKLALVHFSTSAGQRRALVGFPNAETAQQLGGMVNSLGFSTVTATNGRELMLAATKTVRYELILVSSHIDRGPLYLVVQDLRKHGPTRETPIIVLAEDDEEGILRDRVRDDPLTSVALRPRSLDGMQYAVDQALRRAGDRVVPAEVREAQAKAAIQSIGELMAAAPKVFDFRDYELQLALLLYEPSLSAPTAGVMAQFGTHRSQQSLLEIANRAPQPMASRQAAAVAFGDSVRRFGLRLTKNDILRQYERYNQSRIEDQASQVLLGAVLDAIELPTRTNGE